ncbi:MAG: DUF1015 domain-containing protein [Acidimicrobiales bacterium]
MARIEPTIARLIKPDWTQRVPSPAHDQLAPDDRRRYVAGNPDSFLTVTRGPEDVPPGEEWDSARAVAESRRSLDRLLGAGAWGDRPPRPALFLYRLSTEAAAGSEPHAQVGIVGNLSVDDYEHGVIRVHEQVHEHRARHLADHLAGLRIQSSPVALAHRADPHLSALVARIVAGREPELDFTSPDGLRQQVWRLDEPEVIRGVQEALADSPLYVIDGHHRSAAAAAHRREHPESDAAHWLFGAVFAADELHNEPFHRVVHGIVPEDLVALVARSFPVRPVAPGAVSAVVAGRRPEEVPLLTGGRWYLVDLGPLPGPGQGDVLAALDVVRLEALVLGPLLGITTASPAGRISYRVADPGHGGLEVWRTDADEALWLMRPVPMDAVLDAADAGRAMPPKSTFFQPKARSGVFLREH